MCNCNCVGSGDDAFQKIVIGQLELISHRLRVLTVQQEELNLNMATSKELITELVNTSNQTNATVARVYTEVTSRTSDLEDQIATLEEKIRNETVTVEDLQPLKDSLETVNAGVKQLDDLNTDEVPVPEPTEPEPGTGEPTPQPTEPGTGEVTDGTQNPVV
jgi:DNA-binding transcriptional MerR regulator